MKKGILLLRTLRERLDITRLRMKEMIRQYLGNPTELLMISHLYIQTQEKIIQI